MKTLCLAILGAAFTSLAYVAWGIIFPRAYFAWVGLDSRARLEILLLFIMLDVSWYAAKKLVNQ